MLVLVALLISLLQICFTSSIRNIDNNLSKAIRIQKCCQLDQYFDDSKQICVQKKINDTFDFSDQPVFDNDINEVRSTAKDSFILTFNKEFMKISVDVDLFGVKPRLTENGVLYLESQNSYHRWSPVPTDKYCFDYKATSNEAPVPLFRIVYNHVEPPSLTKDYYEAVGLMISSFFLMLVLIVYLSLEYLRNVHGMILMAYTFSLLMTFLLLATIKIFDYPASTCIVLTALVYFFFLASFFWMNVMSFDLWKTFRGYVNTQHTSHRGQSLRFQMYCAYAWGVPLLMTIGLVVLDQSDMSHLPWFITPKIARIGCFINGGEKFLYLYVPMLLLIICNWVFYLMTVCNIWCMRRDSAILGIRYVGNNAGQHNNENWCRIYFSLSVVMGLSWVFEIISFFSPDLLVWHITDAYNALMGPMIFAIFIWKQKVFKELKSAYSSENKLISNSKTEKYNFTEDLFMNKETVMQATKQM